MQVLLIAALGVLVGAVSGFDLGYTLGHDAGKRGAKCGRQSYQHGPRVRARAIRMSRKMEMGLVRLTGLSDRGRARARGFTIRQLRTTPTPRRTMR